MKTIKSLMVVLLFFSIFFITSCSKDKLEVPISETNSLLANPVDFSYTKYMKSISYGSASTPFGLFGLMWGSNEGIFKESIIPFTLIEEEHPNFLPARVWILESSNWDTIKTKGDLESVINLELRAGNSEQDPGQLISGPGPYNIVFVVIFEEINYLINIRHYSIEEVVQEETIIGQYKF